MGKKYDVSWAPGGRIGYLVDGEPEGKEAMKIEVRCTSVRVVPSDASGFIVDAEVADRTEVIRQAIHEMTEAEIDNAFGKENADRAADEARRAIDRGLKQAALESRLAEAEKTIAGWESKAIALGFPGHPVDGHGGYPSGYSPVDEMIGRLGSLSARVRELEEALRPVLDQRNIVVNGSMVVTLCLTRDEYNRAARALKGEG